MKKFLTVIFVLCGGVLCAQTGQQGKPLMGVNARPKTKIENTAPTPNPTPKQEEFKPILSTIKNTDSERNKMLANTYAIEEISGAEPSGAGAPNQAGGEPVANVASGGLVGTAFRIHKNWFLTCAHHEPFMRAKKNKQGALDIGISVKHRPDAPGASAKFSLVIDMSAKGDKANGKVFFLNPKLKLDETNTNRGDDLALIYVPNQDPMGKSSKEMQQQLNSMQGFLPPQIMAQMQGAVTTVKGGASSDWDNFMKQTINPFKLLILEESTVIRELGDKGKTSYYFPLTTYHILDPELGTVKFTFEPIGTQEGTHAIFYKRVSDLIPGTSGAPMMYGNFIVSVDSATNCSPMFTGKFAKWVREKMGSDYRPMFVRPNVPTNAQGNPAIAATDPRLNDARP